MLEHPPQPNITQSELALRVADYFDNLLAQRDAILATYNLTPETAEQFCNLRSTDEDRETMLALYGHMVYVIEHKQIPPSELLEQERNREQERIDDFFGKDANIEVPQLPKTITPERIEQWKQKHFELRYLPPLMLEENSEYPGWKNKLSREYFNFYNELDFIQNLPENQDNPHLDNLAPNQLPGCWMLVDTRPKPNDQNGKQTYEDDAEIQTIIKQLVEKNIVNQDAKDGRRNCIEPKVFDDPKFWKPFYDYLGLGAYDDAILRLPRVIEQSVLGQGDDWYGTRTFEYMEEYSISPHTRWVLGTSLTGDRQGGVLELFHTKNFCQNVGFRMVVVFRD